MREIESKLDQLGIRLNNPKPPVGNYLGTKKVGNLLFVSGRKSDLCGKVGKTITIEQAKIAARDTVVLLLAIVKNDIEDLDLIDSIVKVHGFIRSTKKFINQPKVLDGASELLIELFGENGHHTRTATGVCQLPYGATIQLDMILKLK